MSETEPAADAIGFAWGDLVGALVEEHGTLAAVAWKLVERASGDDVASIERALRRLRTRGRDAGGVWGARVLRTFGVPVAIEARARWMGVYHSPFTDLPIALCKDQLRLWDRPPVSESRARVWLALGFAGCALRERQFAEAAAMIERARGAAPKAADAQLELALIDAYLASRDGRGTAAIAALLARAEDLAAALTGDRGELACFRARIADHRAYHLNHAGDHAAALALYAALPDEDLHPFASYRRDAGRAYGAWRAAHDPAAALALAHRACEHAGDGGYVRLRAMGLLMIARISGDPAARDRARAIAARLGDAELRARIGG